MGGLDEIVYSKELTLVMESASDECRPSDKELEVEDIVDADDLW